MSALAPVLYAEDDENDVFFMQRAFRLAGITHPLRTVSDGALALQYLRGAGAYANREEHPMPCLVLLDLSMPGKTGHEVLQAIREEPSTAALPVIVFTSSNQQRDIDRAKQLGASRYVIKPGRPDELLAVVNSIKADWLTAPGV